MGNMGGNSKHNPQELIDCIPDRRSAGRIDISRFPYPLLQLDSVIKIVPGKRRFSLILFPVIQDKSHTLIVFRGNQIAVRPHTDFLQPFIFPDAAERFRELRFTESVSFVRCSDCFEKL